MPEDGYPESMISWNRISNTLGLESCGGRTGMVAVVDGVLLKQVWEDWKTMVV